MSLTSVSEWDHSLKAIHSGWVKSLVIVRPVFLSLQCKSSFIEAFVSIDFLLIVQIILKNYNYYIHRWVNKVVDLVICYAVVQIVKQAFSGIRIAFFIHSCYVLVTVLPWECFLCHWRCRCWDYPDLLAEWVQDIRLFNEDQYSQGEPYNSRLSLSLISSQFCYFRMKVFFVWYFSIILWYISWNITPHTSVTWVSSTFCNSHTLSLVWMICNIELFSS